MDSYMLGLCGLDFKKHKLSKEQKNDIDFKLKIPILNNMALSLMTPFSASQNQKWFRENLIRSKSLIDQVLKIDTKNEKALMRKCNILIDLGDLKECEKQIKLLEEVAFQSERSQIIYNEIKNLRERLSDPQPRTRTGVRVNSSNSDS